MIADYSRQFIKQFRKLDAKTQLKVKKHIALFMKNPHAAKLRRHALTSEYSGHYSISAGGDLRLHFRYLSSDTVIFTAVGSHAQLYNYLLKNTHNS